MKELDELKELYPWQQLQNCIRLNGQVDVYCNKKTGKISVFSIVEDEWAYTHDPEEMKEYVIEKLELYGDSPAILSKPINWRIMDDNSVISFGVHAGKKLANVPADYLLWLLDNNKAFGPLRKYIVANEDILRQEAKGKRKYDPR